ncbi:MAG: proline iminopeptidase-family hydrolase [Proteobacteria bacterium]|nr:proline iminopeptidase-family hydrolase [Pseudomonadota bacterium]
MSAERQPDETQRVKVPGGEVAVYSFGSGEEVLLCLHGGPGLSCDYVRDSHSVMADRGYRVVCHDQLGSGASDRPKDLSLWNVERFVQEVEAVRAGLDLGRVHLLGQSWGTWLGIDYCLEYLKNVKTFTLANGSADIPHTFAEMQRLRRALGPETIAMMQRHEAEGSTDHPEYMAAVTILYYRHLCRCTEWPAALNRSLEQINMDVYGTMWGPNEFCCTGNLKDWSRLDRLGEITVPVLVLTGQHDELTPEGARLMHERFPDSTLVAFPNSSHTPFFEEPEEYFRVLLGFLNARRGT